MPIAAAALFGVLAVLAYMQLAAEEQRAERRITLPPRFAAPSARDGRVIRQSQAAGRNHTAPRAEVSWESPVRPQLVANFRRAATVQADRIVAHQQDAVRRVAGLGSAPAVQMASYRHPAAQNGPQFSRNPIRNFAVRGGGALATAAQATARQTLAEQPAVPVPRTVGEDFIFNFSDAPWTLVLKQFAMQGGMSLQMTHTPQGTLTYFDERRYSTSEALDILNDYLIPQGAILVRQAGKLTLFGTEATIPDGLIPFVKIRDLPRVGRNQLASIAIPLKVADPASAVAEIEQLVSRVGRAQALTNSQRVIVTDTGVYLRRIFDLVTGAGVAAGGSQAFVYELRYAKAEDVASAINQFYAGESQNPGGKPSGNVAQVVTPEKTTNSLIVRKQFDSDSEVYNMIRELDRAPREVLIQAVLVEVHLGNTDEFGVELGFQDSVLFDRSVIDNIMTVTETVTSNNGTQTSNDKIISQTAAPGFNFNNQPLGNNVAINPGTIASQGLSALGVGRVNGDLGFGGLVLSAGSESVNILLRALSAKFQLDILSRPQIRALDNHEALIQVGQQVPVVDGVSVSAVGSANPVIRQDQAGIILKVTPRISPEGQVLILVNAEKSSFQLTPGTGVPIFTDATNGNVIEAPIKDITTANTTVSVQTGQTIVLGGMITKEDTTVQRKVPVLGDIPLLGGLFRYDLDRSSRRELLVFLTPYVIESRSHSDELKEREIRHTHMLEPTNAFDWELYGGGHTVVSPPAYLPTGSQTTASSENVVPTGNMAVGPRGSQMPREGHSVPGVPRNRNGRPQQNYGLTGSRYSRPPAVEYRRVAPTQPAPRRYPTSPPGVPNTLRSTPVPLARPYGPTSARRP
ncbi:MAG: secretin N-terminal domain-containing protein [Planctomycetaceae bacterium]